jgi:hypothetical protein
VEKEIGIMARNLEEFGERQRIITMRGFAQ